MHISSTAIGVHGNAVQDGEVLDYNFYASDPGADWDNPPTASAGTAFLQITQFNTSNPEDFIVVLKLADPSTPGTFITRTIVVEGTDVITSNVPGFPTIGSGEGLIIIEPNDYLNLTGVPAGYEIVGMQLRSSSEGLGSEAGEIYEFNGALGAFDNDTTSFGGTTNDNDVFKILDIGVLRESTEDQSATIEFDVTLTDADGDQVVVQDVTVQIGDPVVTLAAAESTAFSTQSFSKTAGNDDFSALYASNESQKVGGAGFGNVGNTGITSAMVAASGLAAMSMTSLNSFSQPAFDSPVQDSFQQLSTQLVARDNMDEGLASVSFGNEPDGAAADAVNLSSSGLSFQDHGLGGRGLDAISFGDAEPAYAPSYASGEPVVANIPAFAANVPSVSMASAEMLKAVSLEGNVQQGGAVEQVLADTLGNGAPTLDGVLANLPGGIAELAAIANLASPNGAGVPAWDMMGHGAFGPAPDMLFKVEIHQDAVQPA